MTTDAVLLAKIETLTKTVEQQGGALKTAHLTIDKLNLELSYLKRMLEVELFPELWQLRTEL